MPPPKSHRRYYDLLEVAVSATEKEIRRAYLKVARREHPDVNPGDRRSAVRFRKIQEAFRVLSSATLRKVYDREGEQGLGEEGAPLDGGAAAESQGTERIADDIFADELGGSEAAPQKGEDVHLVLGLSLEDVLRGARKKCSFQSETACRRCGGRGSAEGSSMTQCPGCAGEGFAEVRRGPWKAKKICRRCAGAGEVGRESCENCGGRGRVRKQMESVITIPPGAEGGTRITVAAMGRPGERGGVSGDLVVTFKAEEHPSLERRGPNLYCTVPVTVWEAALGAKIFVPSLEGREQLSIPRGTQSEEQFRLAGRGLPRPGGGRRGDFYVTVKVVVPEAVDEESRRLFRQMQKLFPENPRVKN